VPSSSGAFLQLENTIIIERNMYLRTFTFVKLMIIFGLKFLNEI
jgi:hypothetical protein